MLKPENSVANAGLLHMSNTDDPNVVAILAKTSSCYIDGIIG